MAFKLSIFQDVRDYVVITLGLLMYAVGFTCFQLPYEITTGGLAGAGAVIFYATGFPVQYTFFMVNIILLAIAVRVLRQDHLRRVHAHIPARCGAGSDDIPREPQARHVR